MLHGPTAHEITDRNKTFVCLEAKFVKLTSTFDARVRVTRNGMDVGGDSIMGLMMLAASPGSTITLIATGREAEAAVRAIVDLVVRKFDED